MITAHYYDKLNILYCCNVPYSNPNSCCCCAVLQDALDAVIAFTM